MGAALNLSGGTGNVNFDGTISNTTGRHIVVSGRTGGHDFRGAISGTGTGVSLTNNAAGSIFNFTGGLALSTGANDAFTATGGGTVNVCDRTSCGSGSAVENTLATTTGTALKVENTNIGSGGLKFKSISSTGSADAPGILLNNTGSSGGLTVTGTTGSADSGGEIANKTGANITSSLFTTPTGGTNGVGIYLKDTEDVSLTRMKLHDFSNFAVFGASVNGLTLASSTISGDNGNDNAQDESAVRIDNLTGASAITNSSISGGEENNVYINNTAGTLALAVTGGTFGANSASFGNHGLWLNGGSSAVMSATVTGTTFENIRASAVFMRLLGSATGTANVSTSRFHSVGHAVTMSNGDNADLTFNVNNNTDIVRTTGNSGNAIELIAADGSTTSSKIRGTISGNVIGGTAAYSGTNFGPGYGIALDMRGDQDAAIDISGNTVRHTLQSGIWVHHADFTSPDSNSANGLLDVTVRNNNVSAPEDLPAAQFPTFEEYGMRFEARHGRTMCLDIAGNSSVGGPNGSGGNVAGYWLRQRGSTASNVAPFATFKLEHNRFGDGGMSQ